MSDKNKNKAAESKSGGFADFRNLPKIRLELVAYSFTALSFLIAGILWGTRYWGKVLFVVLALGVIGLLIATIVNYILYVAKVANSRGQYHVGLLVAKGFFGLSIPLLLLKVMGSLMIAMMPPHLGGIICDTMNVIKQVYFSLNWQHTTITLFYASLAVLAFVAVDHLRNRR